MACSCRTGADSTQSGCTHMRWSVVSFPRSTTLTQHCLIPLVLLPSVLHTCKKKAPQWSLGMRLGSGSLGTRLGSGSLGTRLGSGSLGTRLDTSQIPGSELPHQPHSPVGLERGFVGSPGASHSAPPSPPPPPPPFFFFFFFFLFPSPSAPTPAPASGCCGASPGTGWSKMDNEVGNLSHLLRKLVRFH